MRDSDADCMCGDRAGLDPEVAFITLRGLAASGQFGHASTRMLCFGAFVERECS